MSRHKYTIRNPRDYTYACPPGFITTVNLADLAGIKRHTVIHRCRRACLLPIAIPRRNIKGMTLGGKPLFIWPKEAALDAVLVDRSPRIGKY